MVLKSNHIHVISLTLQLDEEELSGQDSVCDTIYLWLNNSVYSYIHARKSWKNINALWFRVWVLGAIAFSSPYVYEFK